MGDRFVLSPYFLDQPLAGARRLAGPGWHLNASDLAGPGDGDLAGRIALVGRGLADLVSDAVRAGERPVSVAGDCCTVIAVLAGLQHAGVDPFLVWLDAHGDFNTWETTPSGFMGGMPLAMIVGRGDQSLVDAVGLRTLAEQDVILSDARDLDPGERTALDASAVVRLADVSAIAAALPAGRSVHVHLDTDVVDAAEAPAMKYPVAGGPRSADLVRLGQALADSGRVTSVSMTLWNVDTDADGTTESACLPVLQALLGK
jgi:arginase